MYGFPILGKLHIAKLGIVVKADGMRYIIDSI